MEDSRQLVIETLENASSQDPACMARADESLRTWETKPQFHAVLFSIFADRTLSMPARLMAIITFKNGIDKYWKKVAVHAIKLGEKELIRPQLLSMLDESAPQIAVQYCVAISRIARWEFPLVWPEFAEELASRVRFIANDLDSSIGNDEQHRRRCFTMEHNALYILHLFVKKLCERTLARERQALRSNAPMLFSIVAPIYAQRIAQFNEALHAGDSAMSQELLKSIRFCLKTLRRLYVYGFGDFETADALVHEFYMATVGHQAAFYELFSGLPAESREADECRILRKIILLYGKMHIEFQRLRAVRFITTPAVLPMLQWYWQHIQGEAAKLTAVPLDHADDADAPPLVLERLLIQGLELYRNVVKNMFYLVDDSVQIDEDVQRCRLVIDTEIMTPPFVAQMSETLMCHYIPLKTSDLEMWQDEPDTWIMNEDLDHWEFDVRRSAEHLFSDLVNQHRDLIVPELVRALQQTNMDAISFRNDGLYAALGLCANELYDHIDFCHWLRQHPPADWPMSVARWRIAWLIGKWITVKFATDQRAHAYAALLEYARPGEPLVLRMEAMASLLRCVDDWDFDATQFMPYLQLSIERITGMLGSVSQAELRMRMVNYLCVIVSRMQRDIVPFAESIVRLIPQLWESAAGENLYQTAVLGLVTKLVAALGAHSASLQSFVAPLIQHSIDIDDPAHVYLIVDGIDLWLALVRNATAIDSSLMALLHFIPGLLKNSTETLKSVLKVVEGYALLCGVDMMRSCGPAIIGALHELVADTNMNMRAIAAGFNTLNVIVQCVPVELVGPALVESGMLWTPFTRIVDKKEAAMILIHHTGFMSRIAVHYSQLFMEFLASQDAQLTSAFVEHWVEAYDDVGQLAHRRLHALGLAVAIATTNDGVLKSLPLMVPLWNDILSSTDTSQLYFSDPDDGNESDCYSEMVVPESERRRKLLSNDPAHKFDIKKALAQSMAKCERLNGVERFQAIIAQVSAEDLEELKKRIC
ncbi:hypothetical protein GGI21_001551 [Coemansia aciculifera]|uniref:Uncharacterized protein n=1 Tax=Coemansia aciculifera TaxID=417176 RepID=A0ACC1M6X8_9FUNG|nr:hypothetical protein IWW38_001177 [Coemansia aciculifera]KAJ2909767.1 hypothetical protein GGI21_001551 [Coemansia aciculifera]